MTIASPRTTAFAQSKMKKTKSIKSNAVVEATPSSMKIEPDEPADSSVEAPVQNPTATDSAEKPAEPTAESTAESPAGIPNASPSAIRAELAATNSAATAAVTESNDLTNPNNSLADASLNTTLPYVSKPMTDSSSTAYTPGKKSPPKRDPSKPSSNFTPTERTFILMAIAAVRADPKWRKHQDPDTIKDFSVPFCNAVRQKLIEDPDFKGKVAVASATPDREGKCRQSPSKESIRKIWTNLYLRGSITRDYTNMGRKKDLAAEERVKQYLQQNPDCKMSSRAIAAQTNTSNRNVIRILRQENFAIRKTKFRRPDETVKKRVRRNTKKDANKDDRSLLNASECNN